MKPNLTALARSGLIVLGTLAGASLPVTAGPFTAPPLNFPVAPGQPLNVQNGVFIPPSGGGYEGMVQLVGRGGGGRGGGGFGGRGGGGGRMFMMRGGGGHGWRGGGMRGGGHGWRGGGGGWRGGGWHGGGGRGFRASAWSGGGGRHWNGGGGRWHGGNNWNRGWHGGGWHGGNRWHAGGWHGNRWHGGWRGNNWNCWNCGWGGGWDDSWAAWGLGLGVGTALAYNNYYDSPGYYDYGPAYTSSTTGGHTQWCYNRYRSYRSSDNTFQPNNGPRRQCVSPYR